MVIPDYANLRPTSFFTYCLRSVYIHARYDRFLLHNDLKVYNGFSIMFGVRGKRIENKESLSNLLTLGEKPLLRMCERRFFLKR